METYVKFRENNIFLNKYITSYLINWYNARGGYGPEYGERLYFNRDTICELVMYLHNAQDDYLLYAVTALTEIAFILKEEEKVEFYFN